MQKIWTINERGQTQYTGGQEDWEAAAKIAENCHDFLLDDEDEMRADEEISCYNCRFRRWTSCSFVCMKK